MIGLLSSGWETLCQDMSAFGVSWTLMQCMFLVLLQLTSDLTLMIHFRIVVIVTKNELTGTFRLASFGKKAVPFHCFSLTNW